MRKFLQQFEYSVRSVSEFIKDRISVIEKKTAPSDLTFPSALPLDDWDSYYTDYKTKYPIRYLVFQSSSTAIGRFLYRVQDCSYWVRRNFFLKEKLNIVVTDLPNGYHDPSSLVSASLKTILFRFFDELDYDKDVCLTDHILFQHVNNNESKSNWMLHLAEAYYWFKYQEPQLQTQIENLNSETSKLIYPNKTKKRRLMSRMMDLHTNPDYIVLKNQIENIEIEINHQTTYHCLNIVKYRDYMWT